MNTVYVPSLSNEYFLVKIVHEVENAIFVVQAYTVIIRAVGSESEGILGGVGRNF
jgi:hypothetical protein